MKTYSVLVVILLLLSCNESHSPSNRTEHNFQKSVKKNELYVSQIGNNIAYLKVLAIDEKVVDFSLEASNGANNGSISGKGMYKNDSVYIYEDEMVKLSFTLSDSNIKIEQIGSGHSGLGVHYDGEYFLSKKEDKIALTKSLPFLTKEMNLDLIAKSKNQYSMFLESLSDYSTDLITEGSDKYNSYSGFVEGLGTIFEATIIERESKYYFAALVHDDTVYYFSNDQKITENGKRVPIYISEWTNRMMHKSVVWDGGR